MCGIAGFINPYFENSVGVLNAMTDAIKHRGPDDEGRVALNTSDRLCRHKSEDPGKATVFLGHRRLSILDLSSAGHQPMPYDNGNYWITYNGEIYNFPEITETLKSKGFSFKSSCDTEVILAAYKMWGKDCVNHFNGMFAFVIYDHLNRSIFMARDRFGQKPFFYWKNRLFFAFASEIQSLAQIPGFSEISTDYSALSLYFKYGYIPAPQTIYEDISSLEAGDAAVFDISTGDFNKYKYWKPSVHGVKTVDCQELLQYIDESVKLRLKADVPVGVFLSGGIDSSLITSSAVRQVDSVKTFTISTGHSSCDESHEAELIAGHLKTEHTTSTVKPEFINLSQKLIAHYGQPYADYSMIPTYYVSRETRKHVKVALGGDGGDELFAGYNRYANRHISQLFGLIPYHIKKPLAQLISYIPSHLPLKDFILTSDQMPGKGENATSTFHRYWRRKCFEPTFFDLTGSSEYNLFSNLYNEAESDSPVEKWLEVDQQIYLSSDILTKVDIASMAVSLECRAPFLDYKLAEYANAIDLKQKLHGRTTKAILRKLASQQLPPSISSMPKKGFTLPLAEWMRSDLREWTNEIIFDNRSCWSDFLKEKSINLMWHQHQTGICDHSMRLWQIVAFVLWNNNSFKI